MIDRDGWLTVSSAICVLELEKGGTIDEKTIDFDYYGWLWKK
jgi:hypothetical protein